MAAMNRAYNSILSCGNRACASALVLPITDAAIILVVSVVVCLRIMQLGT